MRLRAATAAADAVEALVRQIEREPGVADVQYDRRWLDRLASVTAGVRWVGMILALVLGAAAALTVANVVRLALYARRDEIEIMQLVGAPLSHIRGPFVAEGILHGGAGSLLALRRAGRGLRCRRAAVRPGSSPACSAACASSSCRCPCGILLVTGGMAVGCVGGWVAARGVR